MNSGSNKEGIGYSIAAELPSPEEKRLLGIWCVLDDAWKGGVVGNCRGFL
jgi:hypothetical protein